jgi:hypothetical protein
MSAEFLMFAEFLTGFYILFGVVLPLVSVLLLRSSRVKFDVWQRSLFVFTFLAYASWYATGIVWAMTSVTVGAIVIALYLGIVVSGILWGVIAYRCGLYVNYSGHEVVYKHPRGKVILYIVLFALTWIWVLFAPIWLVEYSWHRMKREKEVHKIYAKLEGQPELRKRKRTWEEVTGGE